MGDKLVSKDGKTIYEFPDDTDGLSLLFGYMTRAKFGDKFESQLLFSPWGNELMQKMLDELTNPTNPLSKIYKQPYKGENKSADDDYSDSDKANTVFFSEFTAFVASYPAMLKRWNWSKMTTEEKVERLRQGLFPHPISYPRTIQMIKDIDHHIWLYSQT